MESISLQTLQDLCSTRIAYLMWTRHDLNNEFSVEDSFDRLVDIVLTDVQNLPLPQQVKSRILDVVKPAGKRLLSLLESWLWKTRPENDDNWLTGEMLFECLILNAVGLIDERRTAEKILSSRMPAKSSRVDAFRLACVNCLEREVLQLWKFARRYLLRKIVTESGNPCMFSGSLKPRNILRKRPVNDSSWKYIYTRRPLALSCFSCTSECDEVLFWISYCLSKENGTNLNKVPHFVGNKIPGLVNAERDFTGNEVDWYEFSLESAADSGNVAWLDYFINICKTDVEYNFAGMVVGKFYDDERNTEQPFFIFHYLLLDSQEKAELFREYPKRMMCHFLQWPLSHTFVENAEEIWNSIPDESKDWLVLKIFAILFHENPLLNPITDYRGFPCGYLGFNNVIRNVEHLRGIWIALWKISSDSHKMKVLKSLVFRSITHSETAREFRTSFEASGLKNKLLHLFLSNGESVLELYEGKTMKETLRNLVAKYMPEDFEDLNRNCLSYLKNQSEQSIKIMEREMKEKVRCQYVAPYFVRPYYPQPVHDAFLHYIKKTEYLN